MSFVPLVRVADVQLGKMLSPKAKTGAESYPYLRNQNVQWWRLDLAELAIMDFSEQDRRKFELKYGDLLVCEGGEPGRCTVWQDEVTDCFYQKALHRVRPHEGKADSDFLSLWIRHQAISGAFADQNAKTTIAHLPQVRLEQLLVPAIDIAEQRCIAARLKAQLAEVARARQAAQAQLRDVALLQRRLLQAAFDRLVCAPTTLGCILNEIQTGKSFLTAEVLARPDELGVLKVSAVSWAQFRADQAKALKGEYAPAENHRVKQDDLLISRANTRELVGAVVLVERDYPMRLLSDKTLRLVVDESRANKDYLLLALRTELARKHIELYATGTSDSMRNISQDVIASIPILLPPLDDQRHIVARLKSQLDEADTIIQAATAQLAEIDRLPQRLLAQTFNDVEVRS